MRKRVVGIMLGTALLLSACGSMGTSGEAAGTVTGQVANYDGPAGALEATDDFGGGSFGAGSIQTDGSFTLELEPTIPQSMLRSTEPLQVCPGISFSDAEAMTSGFNRIYVEVDGTPAGTLSQTSSSVTDQGAISTIVARTYADRDVSMVGKCESEDSVASIDMNLDLKGGWNVVTVVETSDSAFPSASSFTYTMGAASDVDWAYESY